jgi:hypothetical protein
MRPLQPCGDRTGTLGIAVIALGMAREQRDSCGAAAAVKYEFSAPWSAISDVGVRLHASVFWSVLSSGADFLMRARAIGSAPHP